MLHAVVSGVWAGDLNLTAVAALTGNQNTLPQIGGIRLGHASLLYPMPEQRPAIANESELGPPYIRNCIKS
jgi:hypothetical protein